MALTSSKLPGRPRFPPPNVTHVWPVDDALAQGALLPERWPAAWITCHLWTVTHTIGGTGGIPTFGVKTDEPIMLHDAYSPSAQSVLATGLPGTVNAAFGAERCGYLWREYQSAANDVAVELALYLQPHNGGDVGINSSVLLRQQFVCARVSGGSVASATGGGAKPWGDEYWLQSVTDGYFFGVAGNGANGSEWILFKLVAGVPTTLASVRFNSAGASHFYVDEVDPYIPHFYRMAFAAGAAGSLDITCTYGATTLLEGGPATVNPFGGPVNDPTPIATAGRCGFQIQATKDNGAGTETNGYSVVVPYVRVDVGAVTRVTDRWLRRQRRENRQANAPFSTTEARDLRSGWIGDNYSEKVFGVTTKPIWMRRGSDGPPTPGDRVLHSAQFEPIGSNTVNTFREGLMVSQRLADFYNTQHRRVRFRFSSLNLAGAAGTAPTGVERRWAGVFTRLGSGVTTGDLLRGGYLLQASTDDGGTFASARVELWRANAAGSTGLLVATGTPAIAMDTDHTLALQTFNIEDAGGNPDSVVVIKCFLNGSLISLTLTAAALAAGLASGGTGIILDNTSGAHLLGGVSEGMRIAGFTGTRVSYLDQWTQLALEGPTGTSENDQVGIVVLSETHDYTGQTLTVPYDYSVEEVSQYQTLEFRYETGYVRRALQAADARRRWRIHSGAATNAEKATLLAFWDAHDGATKAFAWVPPDKTVAVKVHFVHSKLPLVLRNPNIHSFSFELEELFDG